MKSGKLLIFLAMLALALGVLTATAYAAPPGPDTDTRAAIPEKPPRPATPDAALDTAPGQITGGGESLSGSFVVFDPSVGGAPCYNTGEIQTFCFRAESFTTDYEYVLNLWERFPPDWTVLNVYVQGTPSCDSGVGWFGTFGWSFQTPSYEVNISHPRYQQSTDHCTAYYCFEVVSGTGTPNALESWYWAGDGWGGTPHWPCSSDQYTPAGQSTCDQWINPQASIPPCVLDPGVYLTPPTATAEGCNGEPQTHTFQLFNNTGADGNFSMAYSVPTANGTLTGPASVAVANGQTASFDVVLTPDQCLQPGDTVIGVIQASGNGFSDQSTIDKTIVLGVWANEPASPVATMDHAAVEWNGKLYVVMGYGSNGAVQIYDPVAGWTLGAPNPNAYNDYSNDACLGLDAAGNPVIDVLGDATTFFNIQRYDINANAWTSLPYPAGYPATGLWAADIVSMLQHTGQNVCYISGGATAPGGGNSNALYRYDPAAQTVVNLGNYSYSAVGIAFHFSWWVPWVQGGAICAAGGVDANSVVYGDSQCYYITPAAFGVVNADLGPLPQPWWGGADGWKIHGGKYQIWGYNGVDANFALLQASFYEEELTPPFVYGPAPLHAVYRLEGDHFLDSVWAANGSTGGFAPSTLQEYLTQCPTCAYEWLKFVNGVRWEPTIQVTVQTSDTIQVTEIVTTELPFNLVENWNPAHLRLLGYEVSPGGIVITNTGYLEWHQTPTGPGPWYIIKWFHVEPCDWTNTLLDEVLFVGTLPPEPRPVPIFKVPPQLWINALYQPPVTAGQPANFTLRFGNDGGYENNVMIRNDFPGTAPFIDSIPPPNRVGPGGLWVEWDVGNLPQGAQSNIDVTVMIQPGTPPSTTISIVDVIFDHMRVERGRVNINFHVVPMQISWDKTIDGMAWQPGMAITRQTSDTIVVQEVLHLTPPLAPARWKPAATVPPEGGWLPAPAADLVGATTPQGPAPAAAPGATWKMPDDVLYDNGPLVTHPANCSGVDASRLQNLSLGMGIYGFGHQLSAGNRVADDFTITDPGGWQIDQITFFAYQSGSPTNPSTINHVNYQIWDGPPGQAGSSVVFGDTATNRLVSSTWAAIYRDYETTTCGTTRPIMADVASAGVALPPGTYWLDWQTGGTLSSGPWAPPITILGQTTTGNGLQYLASTSAWQAAMDVGQQGLPFIIEGTIVQWPVVAQIETWDPTKLHLLDWAATGGQVSITPGQVVWTNEVVAPTTITLTKWFHVEPCTWTQTVLWEELWLDQTELDQRPVVVNKLPPVLWIDAAYQPGVQPGSPANFSLSYGNTGGFDNDVWVRNNFPPEAPFASSVPPPTNVDPNGLWAEWYVGGLPMGAQGNIDVTVMIQPGLPVSTTIDIWDGIFDHTGELRDWVVITFHVQPPPIVWDKYIDGMVWQPGMDITRQTSDTIEVVEVIHIVPPPLAMGEPKPVTPQANADTAPASRAPIGTLALGDLLFEIDFQAAAGDTQLLGVEFDGTFYWVTGGNTGADPNKLYKFDTTGALMATYNQPATCTGWGGRDLAFDGTYLYFGCDNGLIYQIDPATGGATGTTIPDPITPARALAYDPGTDHFWAANWDSLLYEFDRTGAIINGFAAVGLSTYGMAWDSWSAGGPFLWLWSQDGPDPLLTASQVNPTTGLLTGVTFLGSGVVGEMAGGAAISNQVVPGKVVLLGMNQGVSDRVGGYELSVLQPGFAQIETWDPTKLHLVNWAATGGEVVVEPDRVVWTGMLIEPATITLTKWFHVEPCTWTVTTLWEELWLGGVELEQRPVLIHKLPPILWIDAVGGGPVFPGQQAQFSLLFGNAGGFDNDVMIRNNFPVEAPFVASTPPPDRQDPNGLWAEWDIAGLPMGGQGNIDVTVMIQPSVPPSTTIEIWDGIFDHTGELRDWVIITFHVEPPPLTVEWEKYVDGVMWTPGMEITRQTSDTIVVVEVINIVPPPKSAFVPVKITGPDVDAPITLSAPARPLGAPEAPAHPDAILWDQPLSTVDQGAYVNQEFSDFADYSSFLADDFVNANPWNISTIFVPGDGWNGFTTLFNATALTWQIYADSAGVPDGDPSGGGNPPVWTLTLAPTDPQVVISTGTPGGYPSNTTLYLATPLTLPAGHWWLVFYPTLNFGSYGQFGRQPADTTNGYVGEFINPGGGFGLGTVWQDWTVLGGQPPDIAFRLEGPCCQGPDFAQIETWDPTRLHLVDWAATGGEVVVEPGRVVWTGMLIEPATITLTKWFHVEPCTWTVTTLWEELWLGGVELEQRPVVVHKLPANLWIDAVGGGPVWAGRQASFTLLYGNAGGFENDVWIRNDFPPTAPFAGSVPPPTNVDPNGLWAEWYVGDLPLGAQGSIDVTVAIQSALPSATIIDIVDYIFDHTGQESDRVTITFRVAPSIYLPVVFKHYVPGP